MSPKMSIMSQREKAFLGIKNYSRFTFVKPPLLSECWWHLWVHAWTILRANEMKAWLFISYVLPFFCHSALIFFHNHFSSSYLFFCIKSELYKSYLEFILPSKLFINTSFAATSVIINSGLTKSFDTEWCSAMEKTFVELVVSQQFQKIIVSSLFTLQSQKWKIWFCLFLFFSCFKIFFFLMPV